MFLLTRLFNKMIRDGELTIVDHRGTVHRFGSPSATIKPVRFRFTDAATARAVALGPAIGAGEGYMNGTLIMEEGSIFDLVQLVTYNVRWDRANPVRLGLWRQAAIAAKLDQINFERRAKRNVAHHYDLSDRLYDLFLDADRQYSCAYYEHDDDSLETAQRHKKAHIAAKLDLKPGQRVLDIGCGWGGMALYLHRVAGVDVTGVTLSEEQLKVARRRAADAGVADHVRFELIDYRAVTGPFDRIVSVGMFEHVGLPHYRQFFDKVHSLLTPDGVALIHTIARADGPGATDPWTAKYIFPGGYAPALSQITPGGRARVAVDHRHRGAAPPLCADARGMVPPHRRRRGQDRRAVRRALLPHVAILSVGGGRRVPQRRPYERPGPADPDPRRPADHPRLHGRGRGAVPRAGLSCGPATAGIVIVVAVPGRDAALYEFEQ